MQNNIILIIIGLLFAAQYLHAQTELGTDKKSVKGKIEIPHTNNKLLWVSHSTSDTNLVGSSSYLSLHFKIKTTTAISKGDVQLYLDNVVFDNLQELFIQRPIDTSKAGETKIKIEYEIKIVIAVPNEYSIGKTFCLDLKLNSRAGIFRSEKAFFKCQEMEKPKLYVLVFGVDHPDIGYATKKDAKTISALFSLNKAFLIDEKIFRDVEIFNAIPEATTAANLLSRVKAIKSFYENRELKTGDIVLIYISSHGYEENGDIKIQGEGWEPSVKEFTTVSYQNHILNELEPLPLRKIILLDICRNDLFMSQSDFPKFEQGTTTISSSSSGQKSLINPNDSSSVFASVFTKGLYGEADNNNDGKINLTELYSFLENQVPKKAHTIIKDHKQNPDRISGELGSLDIFAYKKERPQNETNAVEALYCQIERKDISSKLIFSYNADGSDKESLKLCDTESKYEINIYDRWGKIVYRNSQNINNWDTKDSQTGELLEQGNYSFTLKYNALDNASRELKGSVTIIRGN